jgi:hypothetical protein
MRVKIERDADRRMTQALGDDLGVHAGLQRERRVRVTKIVQADVRHIDRLHIPVERLLRGEPLLQRLGASVGPRLEADVNAVGPPTTEHRTPGHTDTIRQSVHIPCTSGCIDTYAAWRAQAFPQLDGARGGTRTRTVLSHSRGLSPLRLPVTPPGPGAQR